ncbi:hypothetical protein [Streptomyces noursei]|uniref:hypothetical protein n=1 Tax=Streptomyces noursei TaxID=1971 RepID=UPI001F04F850|nr:hypothetical protein [Streptomyces noursei]
MLVVVQVLGMSGEDEMVASFLSGELTSRRFGPNLRSHLAAGGQAERLLTHPDLSDAGANFARRALLAATRGYGENRDLFENFPGRVTWIRALLSADEASGVRYLDYSYWVELSGGSRRPADAAARIKAGRRAFDVPNEPFVDAAHVLNRGERFPPLIFVGERQDALVCLEGNLRLTAYALAGFPTEVECLIGTAPAMGRWACWQPMWSSWARPWPASSSSVHPPRCGRGGWAEWENLEEAPGHRADPGARTMSSPTTRWDTANCRRGRCAGGS